MPAILEGYTYDVFISYRQKDNKHDGWVTRFVENLKGELEAASKEDITVYFDANPHDMLQETHNVDKSLEDKLKCLVFIPVLSRTYCDPSSYAWKYELLPFIRIAGTDMFGMDVRLSNGNVASRILPVKIHELENEDRKLFEKETGGVLRSLDFVFRTAAGVNRPLKESEENPGDNINRTSYSDQINKAANAIIDILNGLKSVQKTSQAASTMNDEPVPLPEKRVPDQIPVTNQSPGKVSRLLGITGSLALLVIIGMLIIPKLINQRTARATRDKDGKFSIVVNSFDNLTGDTTLKSWQAGIPELLIYNLGTSGEISVRNSQDMSEVYKSLGQKQAAALMPSVSRDAAIKLKAGSYITGSFQKAGTRIRIIAKLFDTDSNELLWTDKIDGTLDADYIALGDSLSIKLKNFLEIKALKNRTSLDFRDAYTGSASAYRKYQEGVRLFTGSNFSGSIKLFEEAWRIDTTFTLAAFYVANANNIIATYSSDSLYTNQAMAWTRRAFIGRMRLPGMYQKWLEMWYDSYFTKDAGELLKCCELLQTFDTRSRYFWYDIGVTYQSFYELWDKSVSCFRKVEEIDSETGENWSFENYYKYYSIACHKLGSHDKESEILEKGLKVLPDNSNLIYQQAVCAISTGDTARSNALIKKELKKAREAGWNESGIEFVLGNLYVEAGFPEIAEKHYRLSLRLGPDRDGRKRIFGNFLMKFDRNLDEGFAITENLLKKYPEDVWLLWDKGYALYKYGKFDEALQYLLKARANWDQVNPLLDKQIDMVKDSIAARK